MRCTLTATNRAQAGFTLIEMLIIAPIILIMISGFIALMVGMVGDVLQTRDQNVLTYNAQSALDRIEQDTRLSSKFLSATGPLTAPQGSNNNFTGTSEFTNASNTLIFSEPATDESPTSPTRSLIYYAYQPNPCGTSQTFNRIFTLQVVYFIKDGSLWRRTIVPEYNTNATPDINTICDTGSALGHPWAQDTCSPGHVAALCETNDEEIMKNIESLDVEYYDSPNSTTDLGAANAEQATTIGVTITGEKTTAGHTFTTSDSLRATKINSLDVDVEDIQAPSVSHTLPTPDKVTFSWAPVLGAVTYNSWYNINGGAWQYMQLSSGTTSRTIDVASRGDTVTFVIEAVGVSDTSEDGIDTATLPLWSNIPLQNNWENYGSEFAPAQFTKSSNGTVFLKGVVKSGSTGVHDIIGTLPEGYRPSGRLVYQVNVGGYDRGRLDVGSDGNIRFVQGNNNYMILDGINFLPSTSPYSWTNYTFSNGWSNWGGEFEPVRAAKDSLGRVHTQGLAAAGNNAHNTIVASPPSATGLTPNYAMHFPSGAHTWSNFWVWYGAAQLTKRGSGTGSSYMSFQSLYYPGSAGGSTIGWTNLTGQNGWGNYGSYFPPLQYTKASDKVCTVRGVIEGGTTTIHTTMTTLPAACRPTERTVFTVVSSSDAHGRVDIFPDGKVSFEKGSSGWMALNFSFISD